jgi:hypothetical protein
LFRVRFRAVIVAQIGRFVNVHENSPMSPDYDREKRDPFL